MSAIKTIFCLILLLSTSSSVYAEKIVLSKIIDNVKKSYNVEAALFDPPGDGDCGFHALAISREKFLQEIDQRVQEVQDMEIKDWTNKRLRRTKWLDTNGFMLMAYLFRFNLETYEQQKDGIFTRVWEYTLNSDYPTRRLLHVNHNHWVRLVIDEEPSAWTLISENVLQGENGNPVLIDDTESDSEQPSKKRSKGQKRKSKKIKTEEQTDERIQPLPLLPEVEMQEVPGLFQRARLLGLFFLSFFVSKEVAYP